MKSKPFTLLPRDIARFWKYVQRAGDNECWPWMANLTRTGYGQLSISLDHSGQGRSINRMVLAHRCAWLTHRGAIPDGLLVCHTCDNRRCVNPAHLFLGTYSENTLDASRKGRLAPRPNKLRADVVAAMLSRRASGETTASIAKSLGVGWTTVKRYVGGECSRLLLSAR